MSTAVIVLSRTESNVTACVDAVATHDPHIPIIVVWDTSKGNGSHPGLSHNQVKIIDVESDFVFARNANIGIRAAEADGRENAILLNDDAILQTHLGFTKLAQVAMENRDYGVIAAAVQGHVGNLNQKFKGVGLRVEPRMVCFICAFLPSWSLQRVGLLDEEFTGYGMEDDALCLRLRQAGYKIGVYDGCVVEHGTLPSTFRDGVNRPDVHKQFLYNRDVFVRKFGAGNHDL